MRKEKYMRFKTYEELKDFCQKTFLACHGQYFKDELCNHFYTIEIHHRLLV